MGFAACATEADANQRVISQAACLLLRTLVSSRPIRRRPRKPFSMGMSRHLRPEHVEGFGGVPLSILYDNLKLPWPAFSATASASLPAPGRLADYSSPFSSSSDRLTRSLADFAKLVELFDEHGASPSRSRNPSTRPRAWAGSPSMSCSPSPSSNGKSSVSGSKTRSPL
jgi:hypothetical protein